MDEGLEQKFRCYMKDCGCSQKETDEYLQLAAKGSTQEQIFFLKRHRNRIMEKLHIAAKQVDCIDYVIYELEQEDGRNG